MKKVLSNNAHIKNIKDREVMGSESECIWNLLGTALKYAVDMNDVRMVDFHEDVELAGQELADEIFGGLSGVDDLAC